MPLDNAGGLGGIGASLGRVAAKAAKRTTSGRGSSVGRSVARVARPRVVHSSRSSRSSGHSSGGSSVGRSVAKAARKVAAPRPARPVVSAPSINAYLGTDASYQNVVRGGKRSLSDFLSEMQRRRGEATTQYNQTNSSMERDRTQQLADLRDEYASRGLIQSGLYGQEQGKFQQQFTQQHTALQQQQAALLADLLSQQKNYQREQDLSLEAAKQDALARRAAKYKIGA
jgi:hypothetical protein